MVLVTMSRVIPETPGGPVLCDVQPQDVNTLKARGWLVVKSEPEPVSLVPAPAATTLAEAVIAPAQDAASPSTPKFDAMVEAIGQLLPNDFGVTTGAPKVSALQRVMREPVSVDERDAAWLQYLLNKER